MPVNFYHEEHLMKIICELAKLRYHDIITIDSFDSCENSGEHILPSPLSPEAFPCEKVSLGDLWKGRDHYKWMQTTVQFPEKWSQKNIIGIFDFGTTGGGHNSGFESLLFVNDKIWQGVDSNHKEVIFGQDYAGKTAKLDFYLWSGLEGGGKHKDQIHHIKRADIGWLDPYCDNLFCTGWAILNSIKTLGNEQPEKSLLPLWLKHAVNMLDFTNDRSQEFYDSVKKADQWLTEQLHANKRKLPVTVHCCGHTHIDLAWLWRIKHTREKAIRSFSTVDRLMETNPNYIFFQSTPQLYEFIKEDAPELYKKIQKRVQEGRWDVGGAMWVEADCNISSGESLARQLLYGIRFFEQEFGVKSTFLWLPDVFGYSWALPQLLKQCDINNFYTTKISWNEHNKLPHDTFTWRGIDGTEILVHFITAPELTNPNSWFYTYNAEIEPSVIMGVWNSYADKSLNQDMLISFGYGDGGGGVNRHMLQMQDTIEKIPAMPSVKPSTVTNYTEILNANIQNNPFAYLHKWDNELYLEYHRGTYTSQAAVKKQNRKLELACREAEFLSSYRAIHNNSWRSYPQNSFYHSWKIILRNQFHDIIPGSSITEVYQDTHIEYEQAWNILEPYLPHSKTTQALTIINSASWKREELIFIDSLDSDAEFIDSSHKALVSQPWKQGKYIKTPAVKPMAAQQITRSAAFSTKAEKPCFTFEDNLLTTPYYQIQFNNQGQITKLYDRDNQRDILAKNALGNLLQVFEDKPRQYDAWELEPSFAEKMTTIETLKQKELVSAGPLFAVLSLTWHYNLSTITQDIFVYSDNPRIDFKTNIDWHERDQLLKVAFQVDIRSLNATYDTQFGNLQRPTHRSTDWEHAKFEVVGHQWADLSENGYGVALLNDCKYGYDIKDNVMRLTLLKSAQYPDMQADLGQHSFTYALLPHQGDWKDGKVIESAWALNSPLTCTDASINAYESLIYCDHPAIFIDTLKKAEDQNCLLVRLHETFGGRSHFTLKSDFKIKSWQPCNLLEKPLKETQYSTSIADTITPYEIKNYLITFER